MNETNILLFLILILLTIRVLQNSKGAARISERGWRFRLRVRNFLLRLIKRRN